MNSIILGGNTPLFFVNSDIDIISDDGLLETEDDYEPTYTGLYDSEGRPIIIYPELGAPGLRIA